MLTRSERSGPFASFRYPTDHRTWSPSENTSTVSYIPYPQGNQRKPDERAQETYQVLLRQLRLRASMSLPNGVPVLVLRIHRSINLVGDSVLGRGLAGKGARDGSTGSGERRGSRGAEDGSGDDGGHDGVDSARSGCRSWDCGINGRVVDGRRENERLASQLRQRVTSPHPLPSFIFFFY
jgi:hypothetical protein